jgi:hypothetical protein
MLTRPLNIVRRILNEFRSPGSWISTASEEPWWPGPLSVLSPYPVSESERSGLLGRYDRSLSDFARIVFSLAPRRSVQGNQQKEAACEAPKMKTFLHVSFFMRCFLKKDTL